MKLKELLLGVEIFNIIGNQDIEIDNLSIDSRNISDNTLYFCLKGQNFNGVDYVDMAKSYGAKCIVTETEVSTDLTQIIVKNVRVALTVISSNFYGNPDRKLKLIGITGTNGKTTTSFIIKTILENFGLKCGVIGTLGIFYNQKEIESNMTTPDPIVFFKTLSNMLNDGIKIVICEVSAHAIFYEKITNIKFFIKIFTNISQDHLDFFDNIDKYKSTKKQFFKDDDYSYAVINGDDEVGQEILKEKGNMISYGINNPSEVFAINIKQKDNSIDFFINIFDCVGQVNLKLVGEYNVYNALASATCCSLLKVPAKKIIEGLNLVQTVKGRTEKIYDKDFSVYIDYAHTPDGLEKTIKSLREICNNRLIVVFGCGGNRDMSKRSIMGEIAGKLADFSIITSDNPRYEEPMEIISQIESGIIKITKNYVIIQNRREAINYALKTLKSGDCLLIAGKGAENYQEILGIKHLYNDKDTVMDLIKLVKN